LDRDKAKAAPDAQRGLPRGLYGEGGHAHREKTRPANLEHTVSTAGARRIRRTAYFCETREDRDTPKDAPTVEVSAGVLLAALCREELRPFRSGRVLGMATLGRRNVEHRVSPEGARLPL
jgi:hypothetical protein